MDDTQGHLLAYLGIAFAIGALCGTLFTVAYHTRRTSRTLDDLHTAQGNPLLQQIRALTAAVNERNDTIASLRQRLGESDSEE